DGRKGNVEFAFVTRACNVHGQPFGAGGFLHVFNYARSQRLVRVDQEGDSLRLRLQIGKHLKPLCRQLKTKRTEARNVTAWPGRDRLSRRPSPIEWLTTAKTIGIVDVAFLAATADTVPAPATITSTLRATRSAAKPGRRSYWPSAHPYSIATFRPSM